MSPVAIHGNTAAFNIRIFNMTGGGFYAVLYDKNTPVFKRRNANDGQDTLIWQATNHTAVLDRFLNYYYDEPTKTLTFVNAIDTFNGITFTRQESYKFVDDYVVENTWQVTSDVDGGKISATMWNYYINGVNAVINIDDTNFPDGGSATNPLGLGIQLVPNGSYYGSVADNGFNNQNNNKKRYLASQGGIAVTWITPSGGQLSLTNSVNSRTLNITQWFFKSQGNLYDFMLQAQIAIAKAKEFEGSLWDKICQVTAYINISLATDLTNIQLIPSTNYTSGMWMRDSFWQGLLLDNVYEQKAITRFESKQQVSGQIPTNIGSDGVTFQLFHDESTCLYIIRAYYDNVVRGLTVDMTVLTNALAYVKTFVVNNQFQFDSADSNHFKDLWDTYNFTPGGYGAYSQGLYALALKCGKKLGLSVTDNEISGAITQLQALYDTTNKFLKMVSDKTHLSTAALTPEALSLFILGEKLLTPTIVNNTIDAIRKFSLPLCGAKNICHFDGTYLPSTDFRNNAYSGGEYQNGGSWFLYEYLAFWVGYYHGYKNIQSLMDKRITQELATDPVSHEYIVSDPAITSSPYLSEASIRHVYAWNAASFLFKLKDLTALKDFSNKRTEKF